MASLPQQSRRQSHRNTSPEHIQQVQRSNSHAASTTSVDSETILVDSQSRSQSPISDPLHEQAASIPRPTQSASDEEPRKCWICYNDETEDTPESSPWRSPCPCALEAHESCLLDWIADLESPSATRSTAAPTEIKCPQCKSRIYLSRPRSYIVEAVGALEKYTGKMLLPGVVLGLSYTVLLGCSHHGAHSIRMIFGTEDADLILAPIRRWSWFEQRLNQFFPAIATPILRGWRGLRVELGLPLIPGALIASRTSLADAVLPVLPIIFFATHPQASRSLAVGYWPPSAALTFVVLPYIRSAYEEYLERVWGERERSWIKEIKPRLGDDAQNPDQDDEDDDDLGGAEQIIDVEIGIEIIEDEEEVPPPQEHEHQQAHPFNAPPMDGQPADIAGQLDAAAAAAAQQQDQQPQQQQQQQPAQPRHRHRNQIDLLTTAHRAADTILGALLFPTISAAAGELLRLLLPYSWTGIRTGPFGPRAPAGMLQTRWGRSVVGGCLFVALKDAVRIYCRWRMAVSYRDRRVRDWDKKAGRLVD